MSKALRKPVSRTPKKKDSSPMITPTIFIGFAFLCFLTALIMHGDTSFRLKDKIDVQGGEIGPIEVKKDNSVFELKANQNLSYGKWSYVSAELLDSNKNYLFSFGKQLWAETGYDSDGRWYEKDTDVSSKFTIKKAGTYYLRLKSNNSGGVLSNINVSVTRKRGSSLPHLIAGIFGLIIGVFLYYTRQGAKGR